MERVEAALKSSIRKEMALKITPPPVYDEELLSVATTTVQNGFSGDDFFVDDLLDLSNDDVFAKEEEEEETPQEMALVSSEEPNKEDNNNNIGFSVCDELVSLPTSELSVPVDDLASLEWLSNFVEDSFKENSAPNLTRPSSVKPVWLTGDRKHPVNPVNDDSCFNSSVPAKARTKRYRFNGVKHWSSLDSSSSSGSLSSGSTSSSSSSGHSTPWLTGAEFLDPMATLARQQPVLKKHKKKSTESVVFNGQRRCSHCGVQKTPQWRAGPMGAKTLCNACGVRFKSGRLLPEYRPACSPTFSSELHSNHHRKVMEMRRKKEPDDEDDETGLNRVGQSPRVVPSF
ncbi:unnamed protein product [Cochlearia groenlandica]